MAVQITIRNVPDQVREALAARASAEGRSMQEYLLRALERLSDRPSVEEWQATVRDRKAVAGTTIDPAEILNHRDVDRR